MGQREQPEGKPELNEGRRKLLKAAAIAGGAAVAAGTLPADWKKPLATVGGLPAHAQTSDEITISSLSVRVPAGTDVRLARGAGIPCIGTFSFSDPLGRMDNSALLWVKIEPGCAGPSDEYTENLGSKGVTLPANKYADWIDFPFTACNSSFSLAVQLSRGKRLSKILNQSFDL